MTTNKQNASAQAGISKAVDDLCADFGKTAGMTAGAYRHLVQTNVFAQSYKSRDERTNAWVTNKAPIADDDLLRLLQTAKRFNLDPLNREIYPYFNMDGSVTPTLTIDGWLRLVNSNPDFDGCRITESEEEVLIPGTSKPCAKWCQVEMFRKSLSHPVVIREYFEEVFHGIVKRSGNAGRGREEPLAYASTPWVVCPRRMLRHRAFIQAARYAFPCSGIAIVEPDGKVNIDDEAFDRNAAVEEEVPPAPATQKGPEQALRESNFEPQATPEQLKADPQAAPAASGQGEQAPKPALAAIHNLKDKIEFTTFLLTMFGKARKKGRTAEATCKWICDTWQGDDQHYALTVWQNFVSPKPAAAAC